MRRPEPQEWDRPRSRSSSPAPRSNIPRARSCSPPGPTPMFARPSRRSSPAHCSTSSILCHSHPRSATHSPFMPAAITPKTPADRASPISRTFADFPTCRRRKWRFDHREQATASMSLSDTNWEPCGSRPSLLPPASETAARLAVVEAARSWIGTPYHHAADIKGAGVDCAMLLVRVYCDLGLVNPFDPRPYTRDWMLHRDDERYLDCLLARSREVPLPEMGDVILFRFGRCFSHGGIASGAHPLTIVHAFAPAHAVLEEEVMRSAELADRLRLAKFASIWE